MPIFIQVVAVWLTMNVFYRVNICINSSFYFYENNQHKINF